MAIKRERKAIGKIHYTWSEFEKDLFALSKKLRRAKKKFTGIWGPARGGLPLAVCLSHLLTLPLVSKPKDTSILIVDDIADTGETLQNFAKKGFCIATLYYHSQSIVVPTFWIREKHNEWIIFPWEYSKK
ncbi:phosphoribosyltransferase [Candidatus Uhrbacteria bacterium]|nr:phosphoribosyltransferase [Candidatus Uhrbacteria bacterium]